jgi:hypothetical protein
VPAKTQHKGEQYREGELELILSLAPTRENRRRLALSLGRSEKAIEIVYRIAYRPGQPFGQSADTQRKKIEAAKRRLGFISALSSRKRQ